jgi:peptidoglycan-associated lipoprotein
MSTAHRSFAIGVAGASLLACLVALAACRTTPEAPPETEPIPRSTPEDEGAGARGASLDLPSVYFDYDSAVLREDARSVLKKNAAELRAAPDVVITLEGHCDERGSEEYNLALGERRAEAVRLYLVDLGIPSARLRVVSFGEAKPAVMGHDESAWKWNRRVESR